MIPVIMEILTDFLARSVSDSRHDTDTTETKCSETDIFSKVEHKTNKQRPTALSFLFTFDPHT